MKTGDKRRTSLRKQSFSSLPSTSKRIYKIFDPLDGLSCHKSILKLDSFLQVPAHPSILNTN